jgi:IS5 family transposase
VRASSEETTLVRFRQRLREHGLHENLLGLVNRQLQAKGLILKTCTLVDATLLQAARRASAKGDKTGGDGDAGYTVKQGQPHYDYKAHVAVERAFLLGGVAPRTAESGPECRRRASQTSLSPMAWVSWA